MYFKRELQKAYENLGEILKFEFQFIKQRDVKIMAQIDDLNTKLDTLTTTVQTVGTEIATAFADYKAQVADLTTRLVSATGAPPIDLTSSEAKVDNLIGSLTLIGTAATASDPGPVTTGSGTTPPPSQSSGSSTASVAQTGAPPNPAPAAPTAGT